MISKSLVGAFLAVLLFANTAGSQLHSEVFDTYNTDNGLSQSTVHCVLQDSRGYLWIGTDDGLNRYDGTQFVQFHSDPADTSTLSNSGVWSICEDSSGYIWVGTQKAGLNRYDRRTGRFHQVLSDSLQSKIGGDAIVCIAQDQAGDIWAGTTKSGLLRVHGATLNAELYNVESGGLPSNRIRCIAEDGSGRLLIGTANKGLVLFNVSTSQWQAVQLEDSSMSLPFTNVQNLALDSEENLWIATLDAGVQFCRRDKSKPEIVLEVHGLPGFNVTRVRSVQVDRLNRLWIATASEGLVEFEIATRQLTYHKHDRTNPRALAEDNLLCVTLDRAADLWIGTWSSGLCRLRLRQTPFQSISVTADEQGGENPAIPILALTETNDNTLLAGTVGHGLHAFSLETGQEAPSTAKVRPERLDHATITAFGELSQDSLLIGSYNEGVYIYSTVSGACERVRLPSPLDSLPSLSVLCLLKDSNNNLWLGTVNHGAIKLRADRSHAEQYTKSSEASHQISDDIIYALHQDRAGNVWVGTLDGLDCVGRDGRVTRSFKYSRSNTNTISNSEIRAVSDDSRGNIWIGTSNGLCRLSPDHATVTRFTESSGLVNGVIYGLLLDKHDNAWVSTNRGLSVIRAAGDAIENYFTWDGLPAGEFNQGAYAKLGNGEFVFGGSQAVTKFNPDSVTASVVPVVITAVRDYRSNEYLTRDPNPHDALRLDHERKHLVVDYSAIEFYGGVQRGYAYRLTGVTSEWIRNVPTTNAVFTNLDPGTYLFEVKREGADDSECTKLEIVIESPWWSKPAALVCWFLLGAGLVVSVFFGLQRRAQRKTIARREHELQLAINRLHLLDHLSILGHNQTTRNCLSDIVRTCNRLRDPEDTHAVEKLRTYASEYVSHTSDKIDDLPAQIPLSGLASDVTDPFVNSARQMDFLLRSVSNGSHASEPSEIAPRIAESIAAFEHDFKELINYLSKFYRTEISGALAHVLQHKRNDFANAGVIADVECPDPTVCFMDKSQFISVLDDLLSNALEAMLSSSEKKIGIRVDSDTERVNIYLSDSGCGLQCARPDWETVFQRRYSTKPHGQGGLGLYNARQTMLRYQGSIRVHESNPGSGTTLRLTLIRAGN